MKIALIEDNEDDAYFFKRAINNRWETDYFIDSKEFGLKADLKSYDVIIVDFNLPVVDGRQILKSIGNKSSAEKAIISHNMDWFMGEDVHETGFANFFDKGKLDEVVEWLSYVESKIKINKCNENTEKSFESKISIIKDINKE